jgi:hypothetical protein
MEFEALRDVDFFSPTAHRTHSTIAILEEWAHLSPPAREQQQEEDAESASWGWASEPQSWIEEKLAVWHPQKAAEEPPRPWHAHRENEWLLLNCEGQRSVEITPEGRLARRARALNESRIPPAIRRQRTGIPRGVLHPRSLQPRPHGHSTLNPHARSALKPLVACDAEPDVPDVGRIRIIERHAPKSVRRPLRPPTSRLSDAMLARLFTESVSLRTPPGRPP